MTAHVAVHDVVRTDASVLAGLAELGVSTVHEADQRRGAPAVLAAARARAANEDVKRARLAAGELGVDMYGLRALLAVLGATYVDSDP